jgi:hypothetical protein
MDIDSQPSQPQQEVRTGRDIWFAVNWAGCDDVSGDVVKIEDWEELQDDCYMDRDGYCSMVGSEHCDFDCPNGGIN